MKNRLFLTLLLTMLFLGTVSAEAANHYVRAGASGNANGSDWANAYTSLPATLTRGDTYYIADGAYAGYTFNDTASGTQVIAVKKATIADHGTDTGWANTYGDGQATFGSLVFATPYYVFDGVTGGGPGSWKTGFGFQINHSTSVGVNCTSGGDNITMRHVAVIGQLVEGQQAFLLQGADNFTLSYYYTDNIGSGPFGLVPVSNFLAEYGYVGRFWGTGASHSEIASIWAGISGTVTFRYTIFAYVYSTGGIMWDNHEDHTAQLRVYGNIFYQDPTLSGLANCCNGWIGGWTGGNGEDFYNARIYNNTFINLSGSLVFTNFILRSGNNDASNNLFYNTTASISYNDIQTHNYNHYIASGGTYSEANGTSASSGNPFVDYVNLNFALTSGTATGLSLPSPYNTDMFGNVRGADGVWDRGAVEFVSNSIRLASPTNLHVLGVQ